MEQKTPETRRKKHSPQSAATLRRLVADMRNAADRLAAAAEQLAAEGEGIWVLMVGIASVEDGITAALDAADDMPSLIRRKKFHREIPENYRDPDPPTKKRGKK